MGGQSRRETRAGTGGYRRGTPSTYTPPPYVPGEAPPSLLGMATLIADKAGAFVNDPYKAVMAFDQAKLQKSPQRAAAMAALAKRQPDPIDIMIREASFARMRAEQKKGRKATFVSGPRGIEGPLGSLIGSGGTSLLGS